MVAPALASASSGPDSVLTGAVTPLLLSGGPPVFSSELSEESVYATRAYIAVEVQTTDNPQGHDSGLQLKWYGEYATSPSGPWTMAGGGTTGIKIVEAEVEGFSVSVKISLGLGDSAEEGEFAEGVLRHLTPETTYYARFHAETEDGSSEKTVEFRTTAVGKPEIGSYLGERRFEAGTTSPTSALALGTIESDGAETKYSFEYTTEPENAGSWKPFTTGMATGTISVAEEFATPTTEVTGLTPETTYYTRVRATNSQGTVERLASIVTPTNRPQVSSLYIHNVTGTTAAFVANVSPHHLETHWRFEDATSEAGPWLPVAGAEGTFSQAQAEALPIEQGPSVGGRVTGLQPASRYYVRLFASSSAGDYTGKPESFQTEGPPTASTFVTHALHGESVRVLGAVNPNSALTSEEQEISIEGAPTGGTFTLTFKGKTTAPIAFDAPAQGTNGLEGALNALAALPSEEVSVNGVPGGPYNVDFNRGNGGEVSEPLIVANASGLTPSGSVAVAVLQQGGEGYDARYHFEYVSQAQFERPGSEGGFAKAVLTPEVDVGAGVAAKFAGADLAGVTPGETYHYRIVAASTFPGNPVEHGAEQTLTVPAASAVESPATCPNEAFRTGPSASLPACRAYEQVTPVEKEGAQELFDYGNEPIPRALVGEDGDHVMVENPAVTWGLSANSGQSPYFLSRDPQNGWQVTAGSAQPEAGVSEMSPMVFSPDLTQVAFVSGIETSASNESKDVALKTGPPGGPYTTIVSVPRQLEGDLVGASADFSTLILQTSDHSLLGSPTGTVNGSDLYEYSGGALRQVNVNSEGKKLGSCGAHIVEGNGSSAQASGGSWNSVSADGSRVFFEEVPGSDCSEPSQLYVREGGEKTVDIGPYTFVGASSDGSRLLVEKTTGDSNEFFVEEIGSAPELLFSTHARVGGGVFLSRNFDAFYFALDEPLPGTEAPAPSSEVGFRGVSNALDIYRYDIQSKTLSFVDQADDEDGFDPQVSPDGRYFYFSSKVVGGVPGGAIAPAGGWSSSKAAGEEPTWQIYRYDSVEHTVECISCASPFDSEPKLTASFGSTLIFRDLGRPADVFVSGDGSRAFFETPAALVAADVDGEVPPNRILSAEDSTNLENWSPSSDVYEWRRDGTDGCAHVQGCLALISSGRGGYLTILLGSAEEGRDVFFYTSSQLVAQDKDTAGDIYDARIGGGLPGPPPRPVECEGDACSTPASAPNDTTPASATFNGVGNMISAPPSKPGMTPKEHKPKKKHANKKKRKGAKRKRARRLPGRSDKAREHSRRMK